MFLGFNEEGKGGDAANTGAGAFSMGAAGRGGSGTTKRTLSSVKTHFFIGTEVNSWRDVFSGKLSEVLSDA